MTKFYSDLFGWKFQKAPVPESEYWLCNTGSDGPGINGAVMQRQDAQQPWMNYVHVASIDAAIEKATKLGGQVALPKMPVLGVGAVAAIVDPTGERLRAVGTGDAVDHRNTSPKRKRVSRLGASTLIPTGGQSTCLLL